jgi:hypothetical protein
VTMTYRPLYGLGWLNFFKQVDRIAPEHCGVVVWHWSTDCPPKMIVDRQFSLPGWAQSPTTDPSNRTYVMDQQSFYDVMSNNYYISPPAGTTQDQFDQAVINSGSAYSLPAPYSLLFGPNSNTAASSIISGAGAVPNNPYAPRQTWAH